MQAEASELKCIAAIFLSFCFPQFSAIQLKSQQSVLTELVRRLEDVDFSVVLHFQERLQPLMSFIRRKGGQ